MSPRGPPGDAGKVFIHPLLGRVQVPRPGLEAVRQVQRETALQLALVKEGLVAVLGLGSAGVLLYEALVDLTDCLLCGCLLKDCAAQVKIVCSDHLQAQDTLQAVHRGVVSTHYNTIQQAIYPADHMLAMFAGLALHERPFPVTYSSTAEQGCEQSQALQLFGSTSLAALGSCMRQY